MNLNDILGKMLGHNEEDSKNNTNKIDEKPQPDKQHDTDDETQDIESQKDTKLFNRNNKALIEDKTSLDLVLAVEQAVIAKQVSDENVTELRSRLEDCQKQSSIIRRDLDRANTLLTERETQIEDLKKQVADKNMQIDQTLDQYRQMESEMSETVDELKNRVDVEQRKYKQIPEQMRKQEEESQREIKAKESTIHELQGENANLKKQLDEVKQQNRYLMDVVRDFTDQVSGSFPGIADKVSAEHHDSEEEQPS